MINKAKSYFMVPLMLSDSLFLGLGRSLFFEIRNKSHYILGMSFIYWWTKDYVHF